MRDFFLKTMVRLRHDQEGLTLVEYGIGISLAVGLGTLALTNLGTDIGDSMGAAGALMPDPVAAGGGDGG